MWMNFIDSDAIKFIVDFGRAVLKFADTMGVLPTTVGVFTAIKLAAKGLKEAFDSTNISAKELRQQVSAYITQQTEAAKASEATATAKIEEAAATKMAEQADMQENTSSITSAAGNLDQASAAQQVTTNKIEEVAALQKAANADRLEDATSRENATSNIEQAAASVGSAGGVGVFSKIAGAATKAGVAIKVLGVALGKAALIMLAVKAATSLLSKAWEALDKNVIHRAENIKQEVEDLKKTYEDAKKTFSDNITTLATSSDTNLYATLEDEFVRLTQGVDAYGNNISLTSEQYERYKQICEQIVGIQPSIASGYDSATKAIGNNASVLSNLIELQKIEARQNAQEYVKDDNLKKIAENAINDYKSALNDIQDAESEITSDSSAFESYIIAPIDSFFEQAKDLPAELQKAYNDLVNKFYTNGFFDFEKVTDLTEFETYLKKLNSIGKDAFGEDFIVFDEFWLGEISLEDSFRKLDNATADLEEYKKGFINALLEIPSSMKEYDKLSDADKSFITKWIENSGLFKIDENTTQSTILEYKSTIKEMIRGIANGDYTTELENGTIVSASDILDSIFKLDASTVDWAKYKEQVNELLTLLFKALGITDEAEQNAIKISFGLDFEVKDDDGNTKQQQLIDDISRITGEDKKTVEERLNNESATTVTAMMEVDWSAKAGMTYDEIIAEIKSTAPDITDVVSVKTYSDLSDEIENYNDILKQTSEILIDNTKVTQDYKDSLIELGVSETDLADCFDENNKLVVKDAKALNNLVKYSKSNISQNVKLAKSQAMLKYKELYQQIKSLTSGQKVTNQATLNQINALYQEMGALQKTIVKYSMLEHQLLGAANAYEKFTEAQEADNATDYIGSAEDMVLALGKAFNTAELGSETARASIAGLVPESVYQDLDTVDEKMAAIYDYFKNGKLSQYFTLEFDDDGAITSAEMKLGNLRKFIEDGLTDNNVFSGSDWQHFEFSDAFLAELDNLPEKADKLQYFADKMGVTKEVAFAFIKSLEDHDIEWLNGDYSSMFENLLPESLENDIYKNTTALAELEVQLANGKITAEDYNKALYGLEWQLNSGAISQEEYDSAVANLNQQLSEGKITTQQYTEAIKGLNGAQNENAQKARDNAVAWSEANSKVDAAKNKVETLTTKLNNLKESGASEQEIQVKTDELKEASKELSEALTKKYNLQEPTEVTLQLALEDIQAKMDQWKADNAELTVNILPKLVQDENGKWTIPADVVATLDETEKAKVDQYLGLLNDSYTINVLADENPDDSTTELKDVKTAAEEAQAAIDEIKNHKPSVDCSDAINAVQGLIDKIAEVKSKTVTITTITSNIGGSSVNGTAHASGSWGLPSNEHNALVGELGPETVVDPKTGRYYTVGDNGAEFVDLPKGAIIFNHKQTEDLLKHGYVTSRGKMLADGTAHAEGNAHLTIWSGGSSKDQWTGTGYSGPDDPTWDAADTLNDAADSLSDSADSLSDATDEFEEVFDWIEIRIEEIDEKLSLLEAKKENETYYNGKNNIIDQMIDINNTKMKNLVAGIDEYTEYANKFLSEIPEAYRQAAQDGSIAITEFAGETDEATVEAINNYREWAQKAADLAQQLEETKTTIRDLAIEKFDNARESGDVRITVEDSQTEKLQNAVDLMEEMGQIASKVYYGINGGNAANSTGMFENSYKKIEYQTAALKAAQDELNKAVQAGQLQRGSNEWYELVNELYEMQSVIDEATKELEEFQNAINDIYWDNFDELINRFDYIKNETENLVDLLSRSDLFVQPEGRTYEGGTKKFWIADEVEWTNEGIASLAMYAEQMELAEYYAGEYARAIDDLAKEYKAGKYSENEYLEKLNELKDAQYENIQNYYDAQNAIKDLNETRIDCIKSGIEAEISAYEELIEKKKEELDTEKD